MCKRCSELEIEIEAAEEYGFGLTSFQLQEELEALQASHLPNKACTGRGSSVGEIVLIVASVLVNTPRQ